MPADARRHAPATGRNRQPIGEVLATVLPDRGRLLEIAAGTGEHAMAFAAAFPGLVWQPTDPSPAALASIAAWAAESARPNLLPPLAVDVTDPAWPDRLPGDWDAAICINMIHIAPWAACQGLMAGCGRLLKRGAPLYLYGPFRIGGAHTAPSNAAFDATLRAGDPAHGVRDLEAVRALAAAHGLSLERQLAMPANNLSVIFRKDPTAQSNIASMSL